MYFESNKVSFHHPQFLVDVTLHDANGMIVASVHVYGRLDEQDSITHLTGFF